MFARTAQEGRGGDTQGLGKADGDRDRLEEGWNRRRHVERCSDTQAAGEVRWVEDAETRSPDATTLPCIGNHRAFSRLAPASTGSHCLSIFDAEC